MAKKKKDTYELSDVEVFEVSLVSKPAIGRTYLLTKAMEEEEPAVDKSEGEESEDDDAEEEEAEGEGDDMDKCATKKEASDDVSKSEEPNPMKETFETLLKQLELDEEVSKTITDAFVVLSENKEALTGVAKEAFEAAGFELPTVEVEKEVIKEVEVEKIVEVEKAEAEEVDPDSPETILKDMEDGPAKEKLAAYIQKEREEKEAAQALAKEEAEKAELEKQERIEKEFIGEAKENYEHVGEADALGKLLKSMKEKLSDEEYELAKGVFGTAEQYIVVSKQFEEIGSGGSPLDGKGTSTKIEALAKELMKENKELTIEQARVQVVQDNQELWLEYNGG
jgi:hypothetical protein